MLVDGGKASFDDVVLDMNDASWGSAVYINSGSFDATELSMSGDIDGPSASTITCSSPCLSGEYGNCTVASGAGSCFINCQCFKCAAGKFSKTAGNTSPEFCSSCSAGRVSVAGASSCVSCLPGTYASSDANEDGGGLSVQVFSGAVSCNKCPAGYYAQSSLTLVCDACSSGKYSAYNASQCIDCERGRYDTMQFILVVNL